jgi:uncharacterized integral membrane protein
LKILVRLLGAAVGAVAIWFALANRGPVAVSFAPLPAQVELPIYLLVLSVFAVGILVGGLSHWLATAPRRTVARDNKRQMVVLKRELDDLHDRRPPVTSEEPQTKLVKH